MKEPATATEDTAPAAKGRPYAQCRDLLPPGTRYCVVCGHNNFDTGAAIGHVAMEYEKRQEKIANRQQRHWLWHALGRMFFWR